MSIVVTSLGSNWWCFRRHVTAPSWAGFLSHRHPSMTARATWQNVLTWYTQPQTPILLLKREKERTRSHKWLPTTMTSPVTAQDQGSGNKYLRKTLNNLWGGRGMKTPGMKIDSKSKSLNNTAADMPDTRDEKMILGGDSAFSTTPTLDLNISVTLRRTLDTEKQKKRRRAFQTNRNKDGGEKKRF